MKRFWVIFIIQLCISLISAYLITQMYWLGKIGVSLFYTEYAILKSFWKVALILFSVQTLFLIILHTLYSFRKILALKILSGIISISSLLGLAYAVYDFSETFSHRILKEKFHIGVYLFLISIFCLSVFYFFIEKKKNVILNNKKSV